MWNFYQQEIVATGRQPLFLALVAFLITLVATRTITRMIRAGKGPFGNVSAGDTHIHHVVPGMILLLLGGMLALGAGERGIWRQIAGILFGIGAALVLDEFAMVLHLDDVYWSKDGQLSADVAMMAAVVLFAGLIVAAPNRPPSDETTGFWLNLLGAVMFTLLWLIPVIACVLKGKFWLAATALIVPPAAWVGAIRVARPNSPWAHFRYRESPEKVAVAKQRDSKWRSIQDPPMKWVRTHIFGLSHDDMN